LPTAFQQSGMSVLLYICIDSIKSLTYSEPVKMLTVRIPEELHKAFKVKCAIEGVDMGSVITQLIESYVKETKPKKQK